MSDTPPPDSFLEAVLGKWEVEGDFYTVFPSAEGGLLARSELTGDPINPAWVISRGRKVSDATGTETT